MAEGLFATERLKPRGRLLIDPVYCMAEGLFATERLKLAALALLLVPD